jgi:hypothetical protein
MSPAVRWCGDISSTTRSNGAIIAFKGAPMVRSLLGLVPCAGGVDDHANRRKVFIQLPPSRRASACFDVILQEPSYGLPLIARESLSLQIQSRNRAPPAVPILPMIASTISLAVCA